MRHLTQLTVQGLLLFTVLSQGVLSADDAEQESTLVSVNGQAITTADLRLKCLVRGISAEDRDAFRQQLLIQLVDEQLVAEFLRSRNTQAAPGAVDAQIDVLKSLIRRRGEDPEQMLEELGLSESDLREALSLPAAWKAYVSQVVTDKQVTNEFDMHRREWDGTQLRARHIVVKVPAAAADQAWSEAERKLTQLRLQITSGKLSFPEAAQENSEGPSAGSGGDVGFFPYRGIMSSTFADAAFSLKRGEISQPVRTPVGVHLIEVTDEQPGQLSLEDVRTAVWERISQELWDRQVAQLRAESRIDWTE